MSEYNNLLKAVQRAMHSAETFLNVVSSDKEAIMSPDNVSVPTLTERSKIFIEEAAETFAGIDGRGVERVAIEDGQIVIEYDDSSKEVYTGFLLRDGASIGSYTYEDGKLVKFTNYQLDSDGNILAGEEGTVEASFIGEEGKSVINTTVSDDGSVEIAYNDGTVESVGNISDFVSAPIEDVAIVDGYLYFTVDGVTVEAMSRDEDGNPVRVALDGTKGEEGSSFYSEEERHSIKLIPPGYTDPVTGTRNNSSNYYIEIFDEFSPVQQAPSNWYGPRNTTVRTLERSDVLNVRMRDGNLTLMWPNSEPLEVDGLDGVDGVDSPDQDKQLFDGEFITSVTYDYDTKMLSFHTNNAMDRWQVEVPTVQLPSGAGTIDRVVSPSSSRMPAVVYVKIADDVNSIVLPVSIGRVRGRDGYDGIDNTLTIDDEGILVSEVNDNGAITTNPLVNLSYPVPEEIFLDPTNDSRLAFRMSDGSLILTDESGDGIDGKAPRVDADSWDIGDATNNYTLSFKLIDSDTDEDAYENFMELRPKKGFTVAYNETQQALDIDLGESTASLDVSFGEDGIEWTEDGVQVDAQGKVSFAYEGGDKIESDAIPDLTSIVYNHAEGKFVFGYSDDTSYDVAWKRPEDGKHATIIKPSDVVFNESDNELKITLDGTTTTYTDINTESWPVDVKKAGEKYTVHFNVDPDQEFTLEDIDGAHMTYISDVKIERGQYVVVTHDLNDDSKDEKGLFLKEDVRWATDWRVDESTNDLYVKYQNASDYTIVANIPDFHKNNRDYTYFIGKALVKNDDNNLIIFTNKDEDGSALQHGGENVEVDGAPSRIITEVSVDTETETVTFVDQFGEIFQEMVVEQLNGVDALSINDIAFVNNEENEFDLDVTITFTDEDMEPLTVTIPSFHGVNTYFPVNNPTGDNIAIDGNTFTFKMSHSGDLEVEVPRFQGYGPRWITDAWVGNNRNFRVMWNDEGDTIIGSIDGADAMYPLTIREEDGEFFVKYSTEDEEVSIGSIEGFNGEEGVWIEEFSINDDRDLVAHMSDGEKRIVGGVDGVDGIYLTEFYEEDKNFYVQKSDEDEPQLVGRVEDLHGKDSAWMVGLGIERGVTVDGVLYADQHSEQDDFGLTSNYANSIDGSVYTHETRRYHVANFSDASNTIVGTSDTIDALKYPVEIKEVNTRIISSYNDGEEIQHGIISDIDGIDAKILVDLLNTTAYALNGDVAYFDDEDEDFVIESNVIAGTGDDYILTAQSALLAKYHDRDEVVGFINGSVAASTIKSFEMDGEKLVVMFEDGEQTVAGTSEYFHGIDGTWIMGDAFTTPEKAQNSYGQEIDVDILHIPVGNSEGTTDYRIGEVNGRDFENEIDNIELDADSHLVVTTIQNDVLRSDEPIIRRITDVEIVDDILWIHTNYDDPIEVGYVAGNDIEDGTSIDTIFVDYENSKIKVTYSDDPSTEVEIGNFDRVDYDFATILKDEGSLFDGDLHIRLSDGTTFDLGRIVGEENTVDIIDGLVNIDGELVITRSQNLPTLRTAPIVGLEGRGIESASIVDGNLVFELADGTEVDAGFVRRDLGFAPFDFLRTYKRGESATRHGRIYVALNEEVNTEPTLESSEWAIVRFEDDPSPDAGRPDVIAPKDLEVFTNVRPFLSGSELRKYYSIDQREDRIFLIDEEDGNFTDPVYEARENADSHQVEMNLEVGKVYKWRMRDIVDTGYITDWSLEGFFSVIENSIATPVVSVPSGMDGEDMNIDASFQSTAFSDSGSGQHVKSRWQIKRNSDDMIIVDEVVETGLTAFVTPFAYLVESEEYSVRVKYYTDDNESAFSDWLSFQTRAYFDFSFKPTIEFDGDDIDATVARPRFITGSTLSRFYREYMEENDVEVFWEVYNSQDELVWSDSNRTFITDVRVGEQLTSGEQHRIRVRYDSDRLRGYSEWSDYVSFTPVWSIEKPTIHNDAENPLDMFYDTRFMVGERTPASIDIDVSSLDVSEGVKLSGDVFGMTLNVNGYRYSLREDYVSVEAFLDALKALPVLSDATIVGGTLQLVSASRTSDVQIAVDQFIVNSGYSAVTFAEDLSDEAVQPSVEIDLKGHDNWAQVDFDGDDALQYTIDGTTTTLSGQFSSIDDIASAIEADDNIASVVVDEGKMTITAVVFSDETVLTVDLFSLAANNVEVDLTSNTVFHEASAEIWEGENDIYVSHDWEIRRQDDDRLVYGNFSDFEREIDWEVAFAESDSEQAYYAQVRVNGLYGKSEWSDPYNFVMQEIIFTNIYYTTASGFVVRLDQFGSEVWESRPSTSAVNAVVVNDDREVFVGSSDNQVYKLDDEGEVVWTYSGFSNNVNGVSYYDEGFIAAGSSDNSVAMIDAETGDEVWKVSEHTSSVNDVMFDLHGDVISVSSDNSVMKLSGETGERLWRYAGHTNNVNKVKVDKDGNVYTLSSDNTLRKLNSRGFLEWSVSMSNGRDVTVDFDGFVYVINSSGNINKIDPEDGIILETDNSSQSSAGVAIEVDDNFDVYSSTSSQIVCTNSAFSAQWSLAVTNGNVLDLAVNRQPVIVKPIGLTGRFYELQEPRNLTAF